jgi:dihydroorotate dehydrogenase
MTLRSAPLEQAVTLPDGRHVVVRVGVPDDPYIAKSDLDTVAVELFEHGRGIAAVNTVLDADQTSEARQLLREIAAGLESGALEPTAAAIEPLADEARRA